MATFKNMTVEEENVVPQNQTPTQEESVKMVGSIPANSVLTWDPIEFPSFGKIMRIHSDDLARKIKAVYMETFHDLKGVNILYTPAGFQVELYFEYNTEDVPNGKIKNLVNLTAPTAKGTDLYYRNQVVQHKVHGESFTINDETKLLLSDCMFGGRKANQPKDKKWDKYISEVHVPLYNDPFFKTRNADRVMVKVTGLNLRSLLRKLYGNDMVTKTVTDGDTDTNIHAEAMYEVRFIKMLPNGTFIMNVEQFDKGATQQFVVQENPQIQRATGVVYY